MRRLLASLLLAASTALAHITPDLPVPGSDALARLYAEGAEWLRRA